MFSIPKNKRLFVLAILLTGALASLSYKLVDLQLLHHAKLEATAEGNTHRSIVRSPLRGKILDSRGNPLALSVPAKVVCADPTLFGNYQRDIARLLAPILQTNENYLAERFQPTTHEVKGKIITNSYVVLKRKVSLETWEQIHHAMTNLTFAAEAGKLRESEKTFFDNLRRKAIFPTDDEVRLYPNQNLAAHVIGYVGGDQQTGQNGIEASFNSQLTGIAGWRRTETDVRRREMVAYRDQDVEPRDGMNVILTIDAGLQNIVETELVDALQKHSPISISCTIVRPKTGEILAMASLPNFNPNRPGASPMEALKNHVISDVFEPGSTFKIVVVSGALNEGTVKLSDQFNCENGSFFYGGKTLHDHEHYGVLSVERIITKSSNIGAAKIAIERLHEQKLYDYIRAFGFDQKTGLSLPGEVRGIFAPLKKWSGVSIAQIPMGQGIAVTPLQTLMAMSAIGNHGKLMRPMIVSRLEDSEGKIVVENEPQETRQVISEAAAKEMVQALKTVVSDDGTAPKARLENYTVAGKTGTAQKAEKGSDGVVRYAPGKYFSSFIGFFPADNPEVCISVVMDEPKNGHYGGLTAAPVFTAIAEKAARYLNLKPDLQPELSLEDTKGNSKPKKLAKN
ncbi:MAG: ftsI [Verrucomicrobiales bacterium]|nr:ftsI [Verrucomicrobiales bacterium]